MRSTLFWTICINQGFFFNFVILKIWLPFFSKNSKTSQFYTRKSTIIQFFFKKKKHLPLNLDLDKPKLIEVTFNFMKIPINTLKFLIWSIVVEIHEQLIFKNDLSGFPKWWGIYHVHLTICHKHVIFYGLAKLSVIFTWINQSVELFMQLVFQSLYNWRQLIQKKIRPISYFTILMWQITYICDVMWATCAI
jgi:hypothetical protein